MLPVSLFKTTNPFSFPLESMDSVASSSSAPPYHHHRHPSRRRLGRFKLGQPIPDRIVRALRHPLRLLHRAGPNFFVLGATGNVYTVNLSPTPSCTCPDQTTPCKHILFVFIRVLGVSLDDVCLRRSTIRRSHVHRLLSMPTFPAAVAGFTLCHMFHQLFFEHARKQGQAEGSGSVSEPVTEIKDGTTCPVCLEEMAKEEKVVACETCRNPIHQECLVRWKRSRGGRSASCVICRATWKDSSTEVEQYLNLSAYIDHDNLVGAGVSGGLLFNG